VAVYYLVLSVLALALGVEPESAAFERLMVGLSLVFLVPALAVAVRRLHDQDKSGWFLLVALFPLFGWIYFVVMMVTKGTDGANGYGPDPRRPELDGEELAEVFA
jgi:uncharacterized membrane protein YhaH (DUF805 family)